MVTTGPVLRSVSASVWDFVFHTQCKLRPGCTALFLAAAHMNNIREIFWHQVTNEYFWKCNKQPGRAEEKAKNCKTAAPVAERPDFSDLIQMLWHFPLLVLHSRAPEHRWSDNDTAAVLKTQTHFCSDCWHFTLKHKARGSQEREAHIL